MARIPNEEIERLKREVSLERLVTGFGIELKKHGAGDRIGRCPFHEDKTPSLVVSPKKNLWNCLGACQTGGTVIDWVMKTRGVSFRYAVELLRNDHPALQAGSGHVVRANSTTKLEAPVTADAGERQVLRQVVDYYHETLKQSPEALQYLQGRGLTHPEMVAHFKLGFANRTLGYRLPNANRQAGAELRGRLQNAGILRESGHEHFSGSVVIPIIDPAGDVAGIYGRKITPKLREGTALHTYLPGPHRGVWNEIALQVSKQIILCESLIDALTFWCAGFRNVTTSYGVNGFTDDHRAAIAKHATKQVWIAYDRDDAGDAAAARLSEELLGLGIECFRVLFPKGMDANEYALKVTPAAKSLGLLINQAQWLGKGKAPATTRVEALAAPVEIEPPAPPAAKEENLPLAVPAPFAPAGDVPTEVRGEEIFITLGDRRYRVRGLAKNLSHEMMKVNILVTRQDAFHVDTLDLYTSRQRVVFTKQASDEIAVPEETLKRDLGLVLGKLEELQDAQIKKALDPKQAEEEMSEEDRAAALELLRDPNLLDRILEDFERCGLVGEETNKKVAYLAAVSRHLETPLAVVVQSSSAAGKSSLMDAVLQFVPENERIHYSAMTGQSLFYMGEMDLKHKVLAIAEEEGAARAAYALKLLQSEGSLSIASTGKDPATGRLVTHQYRVEGPVMIFLTTTAIDLDEELLNRCLVLTVNEEREQTQAIHRRQRQQQTLDGLLQRQERRAIWRRHQNAQRLLKPLLVANPRAIDLTFPDRLTRMRRDHMKYLTLIRAIAFLHQHQRAVKTERGVSYIEATENDVETADRLMDELLGRSLDELPPQTRRLLGLIEEMVKEKCEQLKMEQREFRFSRRDVRERTGWGPTQMKIHLHRLEELEYLTVHQGGRGLSFEYELVKYNYDANRSGSEGDRSGSSRPQAGAMPGVGRVAESRMNPGSSATLDQKSKKRASTGD